jgi:hypothetical protein
MTHIPPQFFPPPAPASLNDLSARISAAFTAERQITSVSQGRPGELRDRYTSKLTGDRLGGDLAWPVVVGPRGMALRVTGEGVLALRDRINVRDGQRYRLSARFQRQTNPTDPSGATVRLAVQWLTASYDAAGVTVIVNATLTVAAGVQSVDTTLGVSGAVEPPTGAVYAVPYIQTFDIDAVTLVEQLEVAVAGVAGPPGPPGPASTVPGPRGPRGFQGVKGDAGNYFGFDISGIVASFAALPAPGTVDGELWAVTGAGFSTIYLSFDGAWQNLGSITTPEAFPVANVIYVQGNGSNGNSGLSLATAVRDIERALELATLREEPTLIEWYPDSDVVTQGHLDMPDDCVIVAKHRTVFIRPDVGFEERNVFRMGSGCFIEGMMFEGWRVDSLTNPTEGFAVSFRPGAVINRVPYAHKIAVRSIPSWGIVPPPLDAANGNPFVPRGGGVVLADGSVCSQFSRFPNIMTWGATPVTPNGLGYVARKGGLINAVNAVSMWSHKHFLALEGGQIVLSACSTQFGDFSMHSKGSRQIVAPASPTGTPTVQTAAASTIAAARQAIIDAMWNALVAGSYTTGWTAQDEVFTRRDAVIFLQCVEWYLGSANDKPIRDFAFGLFDVMGQPVFSSDKLAAFVFSFAHMRDSINALGINSASQAMVTAAVAAINATLTAPAFTKEVSRITAIGHTWQSTMTGVALTKIPPAGQGRPILDSILEEDEGIVIATGQDDQGASLLARNANGTLEVDAQLGLTGNLFINAVNQLAQEAALLGSFSE